MRTLLLVLALAAAGDPWEKVRELKSGQELRIYRKGVPQPILAKMDELGEESLRIVVKDEQKAIPRAEILRIDARPAGKNSRVKAESETTTTDPARDPGMPDVPGRLKTPGTSSSGGLSVTGKPDFETVYRKPPQ
jgi:hypothetical protein